MKKRCEQKKIYLVAFLLLVLLRGTIYAQHPASVTVLPFEINALEGFEYMRDEVPGRIAENLQLDGAVVIEHGLEAGFKLSQLEHIQAIRQLGVNVGADYVIWGSLTLVGSKYSIDIKMTAADKAGYPSVFSSQGDGIENLFSTIQDLSRRISIKLLNKELITKLLVEGNRRIEDDAILKTVKARPGDIYLPANLSKDLKNIYLMGYFEDIRIEVEDSPKGKIVIFRVMEKPTIRRIILSGNSIFDDEEIREDGLDIRTGSILNLFIIKSNMQRIEGMYKEKNYHNVIVTYEIHTLDNNQADLEFKIEEGKKVRIKKIILQGNHSYSKRKLSKYMKTKEKGWFSWLTSSGDLNLDDLSQDIERLTAWYHTNGYIMSRIGEPEVVYEGNWIYITIKIEEGVRFKIGKIDMEGDLIMDKDVLINVMKIKEEEYCNRAVVQDDVLLLTDLYSDKGYYYVDIYPRIDKNPDTLEADVTYVITKGDLVYFDRIIIGGNTKTRDKVIRREMYVYEQELYSGQRLKRSVQNLYRLDFFEDIKVNTINTDSKDRVTLKVDLTEKPTGAFTFGAGYSSVEDLFATVSVSQRNFMGRGQVLQVKAEVGGKTNTYTLGFTEPWLFDIPLSAGVTVYNQEKDYDSYDKLTRGFSVRLSYPLGEWSRFFDYTRLYLSYTYETAEVEDLQYDASNLIRDMLGENVTSSLSTTLKYDSRNRAVNATRGSEHSFTLEYCGGPLGGDLAYTKLLLETGWYIPLIGDLIWFAHARTGYVIENAGGRLPDYERFYLGGMNSLRGFDWRDVSPRDEDGFKMGGDKFIQFNFELLYPLFSDAGLIGVVFYDTGNAYDEHESPSLSDMRESAGFGVRWYSPIGPIRLEWGKILDPIEAYGEDSGGNWEFTMGQAF